jgi:DNA-binding NtrC family response regulator
MKGYSLTESVPFLYSSDRVSTDGKAKKLSVLIIEDEEGSASLLSKLLQKKFSARVEVARDLADARKALALRPFDLICLDYELPDGEGLELFDDMSPDDMPNVIVITGHTGEGLEARARKLGAIDFVPKDRQMASRLTTAVQRLLAGPPA